MREPPWIYHDRSDRCPVSKKHEVERERYLGGIVRCKAKDAYWSNTLRYRDWTAWEQSKMTKADDVPERLISAVLERYHTTRSCLVSAEAHILASPKVQSLLAELRGEPAPVDPLDRLRDSIEALHGISFDRDKMKHIVARSGVSVTLETGRGEG